MFIKSITNCAWLGKTGQWVFELSNQPTAAMRPWPSSELQRPRRQVGPHSCLFGLHMDIRSSRLYRLARFLLCKISQPVMCKQVSWLTWVLHRNGTHYYFEGNWEHGVIANILNSHKARSPTKQNRKRGSHQSLDENSSFPLLFSKVLQLPGSFTPSLYEPHNYYPGSWLSSHLPSSDLERKQSRNFKMLSQDAVGLPVGQDVFSS